MAMAMPIHRDMAMANADPKPALLVHNAMLPDFLLLLHHHFTVLCLPDDPLHRPSFLALHAPSILALVSASSPVDPPLLDSLPNLQIVANFGVGVNHIDLAHCRRHGILVTNTPDVLNDDVADLAILLMLAALRRLCPADRYVRDGLWPVHGHFMLAKKASGLRVGIVGLGRIGMGIAKRAEAFCCTISYYGRSEKKVPYHYYSNVVELAANSDVVILICPLSQDTKHLIGREVLDALGPEGTLINVARGSVVDEAELLKALAEGRLGAAGLDVFEDEPKVPSELLKMDNVVLSPHAGSATWETRRAMGKLVLDNLNAHFSGKPLLTPVT